MKNANELGAVQNDSATIMSVVFNSRKMKNASDRDAF